MSIQSGAAMSRPDDGGQSGRGAIADQVFETLHAMLQDLDLPPGAKISEADIGRQLNASRQSVRDAFYRLSRLGFLEIRPQKATVVSQISAKDIRAARFLRTAIEVEVARVACGVLGADQLALLQALVDQQQTAVDAADKARFHRLDDQFHRSICEFCGLSEAWERISDNKAHTDRVRFISLKTGSQVALDDHQRSWMRFGRGMWRPRRMLSGCI